MLAIDVTTQVLTDGAITGLVYGFTALGIILVYRASGVVNFAYAAFGTCAASFLVMLDLVYHWPFWPSFVLAVVFGAVLSAVVELTVVRRLANRSQVTLFIATVGVAQVATLIAAVLPSPKGLAQPFPSAWVHRWKLGAFDLRGEQLVVLIVLPLVGVVFAWFFNRSIWGLATRASAANAPASRLAGVDVRLVSTLVWTVAGALAALTTILAIPLRGIPVQQVATGTATGTLVRVLTVALLAGLTSFSRSSPASSSASPNG